MLKKLPKAGSDSNERKSKVFVKGIIKETLEQLIKECDNQVSLDDIPEE